MVTFLDEQPGNALAFSDRGGWIVPQSGEVGGESADAGFVGVVESDAAGGGSLVFVVGVVELSQGVVPVGFEAVGHKAVVGVDGQVAAPGEVGAVAGSLDVAATQGVGLFGAAFELGLDFEGDFQGNRGDGIEQELADGRVDGRPRDSVTDGRAGLDGLSHAAIVGDLDAAA